MSRTPDTPRYYVVQNVKTHQETLVRAANKFRAERAVTDDNYATRLATQADMARLLVAGKTVLDAAAPADEPQDALSLV